MAFSVHKHLIIITLCFFFFFVLLVSGRGTRKIPRKNRPAVNKIDYKDALRKSLIFFEGQRSGKLPRSQQGIKWRGDSALNDGKQGSANMDLTGGYYDAGDNVKFNFPMAFTTTILSWTAIEYSKNLNATGEMKNTMEAIRWATDYLLKCSSKVKSDGSGTLYVGIADPNLDHKCWQRPEDMTTDRRVISVTVGSDVAGETAAALAAASIVFRSSDRKYSRKLLATAKAVMQFAVTKQGKYSDQINGLVCPFYCSYSGFKDELLWGAAWMYIATNDHNKYLNLVTSLGANEAVDIASWDNKFGAAYVLLSGQYLVGKKKGTAPFRRAAESFICKILPGGSTQPYTPGGLFYYLPGSNLQYVTAVTFMLTTYSKYMDSSNQKSFTCGQNVRVTSSTLRTLAKKQVDYILGENPRKMSYMVGFSKNFPKRIHHRGSSLPSIKIRKAPIKCDEGFYYLHTKKSNQNILIGAIVGGPDNKDNFADDRDNYQQSEPTTYINAAVVGPLAHFASAARKK